MSDIHKRLLTAIKAHSGMGKREIREAGQYGADTRPGFTYTVDGAEFYRANSDDIDELLQDVADSMGHADVAELVASFDRSDMSDTRDGHDCLLAWFALEEVARYLNQDE